MPRAGVALSPLAPDALRAPAGGGAAADAGHAAATGPPSREAPAALRAPGVPSGGGGNAGHAAADRQPSSGAQVDPQAAESLAPRRRRVAKTAEAGGAADDQRPPAAQPGLGGASGGGSQKDLEESKDARRQRLLKAPAEELKTTLRELDLTTWGRRDELVARLERRLDNLPPLPGDDRKQPSKLAKQAKRKAFAEDPAEASAEAGILAQGTSADAEGVPAAAAKAQAAPEALPVGAREEEVRPHKQAKRMKKEKDKDRDKHRDKLQEGKQGAVAQEGVAADPQQQAAAEAAASSRAPELLREALATSREREAAALLVNEPMPGEGEPGAHVAALRAAEAELLTADGGIWLRLLSEVGGAHVEVSDGRPGRRGAAAPCDDGALLEATSTAVAVAAAGVADEVGGAEGTALCHTGGAAAREALALEDTAPTAPASLLATPPADLGFGCRTGVLRSSAAHASAPPQKAESWQRHDGQEWRDNPDIAVAELAAGLHVKVGGLPQRPLRRANGRFGRVLAPAEGGLWQVRLADGTEEALPVEALTPRAVEAAEVWIRPAEQGAGADLDPLWSRAWVERLMRALLSALEGRPLPWESAPERGHGLGPNRVAVPTAALPLFGLQRLKQLMEEHGVIVVFALGGRVAAGTPPGAAPGTPDEPPPCMGTATPAGPVEAAGTPPLPAAAGTPPGAPASPPMGRGAAALKALLPSAAPRHAPATPEAIRRVGAADGAGSPTPRSQRTHLLVYGTATRRRACHVKVAALIEEQAMSTRGTAFSATASRDAEEEEEDEEESQGDPWGVTRFPESAVESLAAEMARRRRQLCCDATGAVAGNAPHCSLITGSRSQRRAAVALLSLLRTAAHIGIGAMAIDSVPQELGPLCLRVRQPEAAIEAAVRMFARQEWPVFSFWTPPPEHPPLERQLHQPAIGEALEAKYEAEWYNGTVTSVDGLHLGTATIEWEFDGSSSEVPLADLRARLPKAKRQRLSRLRGAWTLTVFGLQRPRTEAAFAALLEAEKEFPGLWSSDLEDLVKELSGGRADFVRGDAPWCLELLRPAGPVPDPVLESVKWSTGGGRATLRRAAAASGCALHALGGAIVALGCPEERARAPDYLRLLVEDSRAGSEGRGWFDTDLREVQFKDADGRQMTFRASEAGAVHFLLDGAQEMRNLADMRAAGDGQLLTFVGASCSGGARRSETVPAWGALACQVLGLCYGRVSTLARLRASGEAVSVEAPAGKCCSVEPSDLRSVEAETKTVIVQEPVDPEGEWDAKAPSKIHICGCHADGRRRAVERVQGLVDSAAEWCVAELSGVQSPADKVAEEERARAKKLGFMPGRFWLFWKVVVRAEVGEDSNIVQELSAGKAIDVEEVVFKPKNKNVAMRIRKPAGWISVPKRPEGAGAWAMLMEEKEGEEAGDDLPAAADWPVEEKPQDAPGRYIVLKRTAVQLTAKVGSQKFATLEPGCDVKVVEVVDSTEDKRIRARVEEPAGWISLLNTESGHRWAERVEEEEAVGPADPKAGSD
ncbi:unnamed protein product [Prorocentrum cordatum]|uniref:SAP domain-containing protein n=1 Tax=Prorocentrum cordatum TaxID=2364126 RepID=A0ABN9WC28_9DINO|nr:unnamed protein product [Polarella glacialis]